MNLNPEKASFWEHLEELRLVLIRALFIIIIGFIISFCFYKPLHQILTAPLNGGSLVILSPVEGFATMLKLSFWIGLVFTSPLWLYSIMKFITPALNEKEKKGVIPFIFISTLFTGLGFIFGYSVAIPLANTFLKTFNSEIGENLWSLQSYFDYTLTLILAHGLAFEFAAVLFFLLHFGFITSKKMREKRSYAYLAIFILAAILTPPDVMTQLMLALPMVILYEALILYGKFREKSLDLQRQI